MDKLKTLTKYYFYYYTNKTIKSLVGSVLTALMYLVAIISSIEYSYPIFEGMNCQNEILEIILIVNTIALFSFGIFNFLSIFYFTDDLETIMYLPFSEKEIFFSKFTVLAYKMKFFLLIYIPISYFGIKSNSGIMFYVYSFFIVVMSYVVTLSMISIFCVCISYCLKVFQKIKIKCIYILIGILLFVIIKVFSMFLISYIFNYNSIDISSLFVIDKLYYMSLMSNDGFKTLMLAILINIFIAVVLYKLIPHMFFKSLLFRWERSFGKRKKKVKFNSGYEKKGQIRALVRKELIINFRTPRFLISSIFGTIYLSLVLLFAFFSGPDWQRIKDLLELNYGGSIFLSIVFTAVGFVTSITAGAGLALSREGKDFYISKYIPISYRKQIISKIISTVYINLIIIPISLIALFFIELRSEVFILSLIIIPFSVVLHSILGICINFINPKLDWESEKQLVKKSYWPLFTTFIALCMGGALILATSIVKSIVFGFILIIVSSILLSYILYKVLLKLGYSVYKRDF